MEAKKKVHNQMNGQRRSGIWTDWNISHTKNKRMAYAEEKGFTV